MAAIASNELGPWNWSDKQYWLLVMIDREKWIAAKATHVYVNTAVFACILRKQADIRSLLPLDWEAGVPTSCASFPCPNNTVKQISASCLHSPLKPISHYSHLLLEAWRQDVDCTLALAERAAKKTVSVCFRAAKVAPTKARDSHCMRPKR
jgi:hypothetical protein